MQELEAKVQWAKTDPIKEVKVATRSPKAPRYDRGADLSKGSPCWPHKLICPRNSRQPCLCKLAGSFDFPPN